MTESNVNNLSNLKITNDTILFSTETRSAELTLINLHQTHHLYFKIKTKIQKLYEVKPTLGCIKPGESVTVSFKPSRTIDPSQFANFEQTLQFLIQAVNSQSPDLNKQEEQNLWRQIKQKKMHLQLGYISVKLPVKYTNQVSQDKEYLPTFNNLQSKINNKFPSNVKASRPPMSISNIKDSHFGQSSVKNDKNVLNDEELSKKYQELKNQEEKLVREREKIVGGNSSSSASSKKKSSNLTIILVFILAFLIGNYLKSLLSPEVIPAPPEQQKGFFDWLFTFS